MTRDDATPVPELLAGLLPRALVRAEVQHKRSQQTAPGMSSLGRCRRQAAYGLAGVQPDLAWEPKPSPAPWIGTWAHAGLLPLLRQELHPARVEVPVEWWPSSSGSDTLTLRGNVDLYRRRSKLVLDVKTCSPFALDTARREGIRVRDEQQVTGYGSALRQMGRPVEWLAVLYVGTATSLMEQDTTGHLWVGRLDPGVEADNARWWDYVVDASRMLAEGLDPDLRDEAGPGLSLSCDGCRWLRACWGDDAQPGDTKALQVHTDPERAAAAAAYDAGKLAEKEGKAAKEAAKARLDASDPGIYTDPERPELGAWTLAWGKGTSRLDQAEATRMLQEAGLPVPYSRSRGSISVRPAEPPT